ncbi:proline rich signal peptide protein [gut metagenome]|uniref:Proline rich signal peptide protein n=1 Tax=gut metagenome TaxID=749906 RepID=J9CHZ2_9ZZZZ
MTFSVGGSYSQDVYAVEATLMKATLSLDEPGERPGLFVASSFEFDLPNALSEALHRGIPLYFIHEFRLSKERWYWFDKTKVESRFFIRLAFDPLTRRYRLSYNGLSHSFDSLEQALPYIKSIRRWRVASSNAIRNADNYIAEIRFHLDETKLPKPMQVVNVGSSDWNITSDWESITIPADVVMISE